MKKNIFIPILWVLLVPCITIYASRACEDMKDPEEGEVIVIGDIRAGKSTLIASLLTEMQSDEAEQSVTPMSKEVKGLPLMYQGGRKRTTTTYATYILPNNKISFIDTRGFEDKNEYDDQNIGQRQTIIELNHIFQTKNVKGIILVVTSAKFAEARNIDEKGSCLECITDFFSTADAINNFIKPSLVMVLTNNNTNKQSYARLKKYIKQRNQGDLTDKQRAFFDILQTPSKDEIKINEEKVILFNPVNNKSKHNLLSTVREFRNIPKKAFREPIKSQMVDTIYYSYLKGYVEYFAPFMPSRRKLIIGSLVFVLFVIVTYKRYGHISLKLLGKLYSSFPTILPNYKNKPSPLALFDHDQKSLTRKNNPNLKASL